LQEPIARNRIKPSAPLDANEISAPPCAKRKRGVGIAEARIEFLRKGIHLLIAFVPCLVSFIGRNHTAALLVLGTAVYASCEGLRMAGVNVPIVSRVTAHAARRRDSGKFVLGPVTLGLGALLSILIYPRETAAIAIYTLAFGDGLSSLVGKLFGSVRIPFTKGKSIEGSLTCLGATFISALALSGKILESAAIAAVATVTEALPLKDFDNIVLPLVAGGLAYLLLRL
jgi:phytol kinase